MNEGIKERISALADGELSEFEARRILEEIEANPELRDYWLRLQIAKSGLKDQSLGFIDKDISKRVAEELGESTKEEKQTPPSPRIRLYLSSALAASLVLVVSSLVFDFDKENLSPAELFATETSEQIAAAIASPQAMQVLDKALTGMDATLQELNSGKKGQIYANYRLPSNGKTFRVSLSPASTSMSDFGKGKASKLTYLETKNGVFIISVSGDISSEKKSQILRNVNFSFDKLK